MGLLEALFKEMEEMPLRPLVYTPEELEESKAALIRQADAAQKESDEAWAERLGKELAAFTD